MDSLCPTPLPKILTMKNEELKIKNEDSEFGRRSAECGITDHTSDSETTTVVRGRAGTPLHAKSATHSKDRADCLSARSALAKADPQFVKRRRARSARPTHNWSSQLFRIAEGLMSLNYASAAALVT